MKDLTFIAEGNPDFFKGGLINLTKRRQVSAVTTKGLSLNTRTAMHVNPHTVLRNPTCRSNEWAVYQARGKGLGGCCTREETNLTN